MGEPTPRHASPFHCPYCGEEEIRPWGERAGEWLCELCRRVWRLSFVGTTGTGMTSMTSMTGGTGGTTGTAAPSRAGTAEGRR